ncbi:MAG: 7-carboxy-7-deazaguanine synthase QueE [Flavobacteriaceae bacterium]
MKTKINKELLNGSSLPLMESFYTIQGEGYHKGSAAYFIRIGGCDIGCHWCDIKESWDVEKFPLVNVKSIVDKVKKKSNKVVITGGEPLIYNMNPLTKKLKQLNISTHLETSGAYELTGYWDWICLSPKKNKLPINNIYSIANELKIIIYNKNDFLFAENLAKNTNPDCKLYLQPEWSKREKVMPLIVNYVLKNNHWKVSLQTHKYLNIQ